MFIYCTFQSHTKVILDQYIVSVIHLMENYIVVVLRMELSDFGSTLLVRPTGFGKTLQRVDHKMEQIEIFL